MKQKLLNYLLLLTLLVAGGGNVAWADTELSPTLVITVNSGGTVVSTGNNWAINYTDLTGQKYFKQSGPVALIKFDASSVLTGKLLQTATLSFDITAGSYNSAMNLWLIKKTDWTANDATWGTYYDPVQITRATDWSTKNKTKSFSYNVKEFIENDDDNIYAFALGTSTGREQTLKNIKLNLTYTDASSAVNYTINYQLNSTTIKTETGSDAVGSNVNATSPFTVNSQKYFIADGATTTFTLASSGNTFNVPVRLANNYNYTVKAVAGSTSQTLATGTCVEGESVSVPYPRFIKLNGTLYTTTKQNSDAYWGIKVTPTSDNYVKEITYTQAATDITFYSEAEDLTGATKVTGNNANIRCSMCAGGYLGGDDKTVTTLPAGKYKLFTSVWGNAGVTFDFGANGNTILSAETKGYIQDYSSEEFVAYDGTPITMTGGDEGKVVDFVYFQRTGDAPINEGAWVADTIKSAASSVIGDSITMTMTGATIGDDGGAKYLYFAEGGTLTLTSAKEGYCFNEIALNTTKITGASPTWTGDAKEVTFTFTGETKINSLTVGENGKLTALPTAATIADFKATTAETALTLDAEVLEVNDEQGYTLIQDATGGLKLDGIVLGATKGAKLTGGIAGIYAGNAILVNGTQTDYTAPKANGTSTTTTEMTVADAIAEDNVYRLVTMKGVSISENGGVFTATDKTAATITVVPGDLTLTSGDVLASLTGVTYEDGSLKATAMQSGLIWKADDLTNGQELPVDMASKDVVDKLSDIATGDVIVIETKGAGTLDILDKAGESIVVYTLTQDETTLHYAVTADVLSDIQNHGLQLAGTGVKPIMAYKVPGQYSEQMNDNTIWFSEDGLAATLGAIHFTDVRESDELAGTVLDAAAAAAQQDNTYDVDATVTKVDLVKNAVRDDKAEAEQGETFAQGEKEAAVNGMIMTFGGAEAEGAEYTFEEAYPAVNKFGAVTKGINTFPVDDEDKAYDPAQKNLPTKGTYYVFEPTKDGQLDVTVDLEQGKKLFVTEDGEALKDFNGITTVNNNLISFPVEATKTYYVFANETNLTYYGFTFVPTEDCENLAKDIATFKLLAEDNADGDTLLLKDAVVTYIKGDNVYVEDASGAIVFYQTGIQFYVGQKLNGYIVGQNHTADNMPQLRKTDKTNYKSFKVTETITPEAKQVALADAPKEQSLARFAKLTDVRTAKDAKGFRILTNKAKTESIRIEDRFNVFYELPEVVGSIQGIIGIDKEGTFFFWPTSKDVPEGVGLTEAEEKLLAEAKKLAEDRDAVAVGLLDDEIEKAEAGYGKGLQAAIDKFNENNANNAKATYAADKAAMQELIAQAEELVADETMTNEQEALEAALADAKTALTNNRLNVAEFKEEIAKLRQAIKAFQEANAVEPEPEVFFAEDFESATTAGWKSATNGRFTPAILTEDGNKFLSVDQSSRNNNGTTVTGTILANKVPADKDFTLEFDMRLSSSTNQTATELQIKDAANTNNLLSLKETDKWTTKWILNGTSTTITLPNSDKGNSSQSIADVTWNSYKISTSKGLTYLTITDKATGNTIFERQVIETNATGGLGNIVFVTSRYMANFAIDNIVVREVSKDDVPNVTPTSYTIKYVDEQGAAIADDVIVNAAVGAEVTANESQTAAIYKDEKKYEYKSGNEAITLVEDADQNVITLVYSEVTTYNYAINAVDANGNILQVLSTGSGFKDDKIEATYPLYVNVGGTLYTKAATNKQFYTEVTLDEADKAVNYQYAATDIEDVIFITEGENIEGATAFNTGNSKVRSSNAASGIAPEDLKIVTLSAGSYTINAVGCFPSSGGGTLNITDGTKTVLEVSGSSNNWQSANSTFTLTEETTLYFAQGGSVNNAALDYLYIQSEDGGVVKDLEDGKYYLINIASEMAWGAGNDWGTRASLLKHPEYVTLHKQSDGTFQMDTQVSNGGTNHFFGGDYMDGQPVNLTFTRQENIGISNTGEAVFAYTIANGDNYYGWDGTSTVLGKNLSADSENALWIVASEEAAVAGLSAATAEDPMDATFLILDPNFGRNNRHGKDLCDHAGNKNNDKNADLDPAWTFNADNKNNAGANENFNLESYHSVFSLSQTLANAPKGVYSLTAQGFYRQDGTDTEHLPVFFANNETQTFPLKTGSENSMNDASASFAKGLYTIEPIFVEVTEDGALTIGAKLEENANLWCIWDNFELTYYGPNADIDAIKAAQAEIAKQEMQKKAKAKLDAMKELVDATNVYTEEAYDQYYGTWLAKYEAGTLTDDEINALEDPSVITGWRAQVTVDDLLMSSWDENVMNWDSYHVNTWSTEGNNDGSNFRVPFIEYWTGDGDSLGEKTLTATMNGLEAGNYDVTAWVRVRMKNGGNTPAYGISLQANDGTAVDVSAGDQIGTSQFYLKEFTAQGTVGADGVLNIKFNVAANNNISWLSFKNVKYEKSAAPAAPEFDVTYAMAVDETHASGESVAIKYEDEDIATLTFGEAGGADFSAAAEQTSVNGFTAFTAGNGTNGNKAGGTFYIFKPKYDGKADFAVVLNSGKAFFIEEDGTALADYNGIKVDEKFYGTYTCDVKAGSTYKVYCSGSKLGFYGVNYYNIEKTVDGINSARFFENDAIYNLRGQKVEGTLKPGLYIKNGRKVVIK